MQGSTSAGRASAGSVTADYDVVIVSTSPVCLLTALARAAQGKRVLLVDDSPEPGGAWITTDLGGFQRVEVGCHLIDPDPDVYRFLLDLGVPLEPLTPSPFVFSRTPRLLRRRVPYSQRWLRDLYDLFAKRSQYEESSTRTSGFVNGFLKPAYRVARYAVRAARGRTRTTLYPREGCAAIIGRLLQLTRAAGIEIRASNRVEAIALDRESGVVRLQVNGAPLTASSVYITASTRLPAVADGERLIDLDANAMLFQNLYLVLEDCDDLALTYGLIFEDRLVHRISDLTRFALPGPGSEQRKIVGLTVDEFRAESAGFAAECLERLKEYRFVSPAARLVDHVFLPYRFTWLELSKRGRLRRDLAPLVQVIDSEAITRSIRNLLRDEDVAPLLAFAALAPAGV